MENFLKRYQILKSGNGGFASEYQVARSLSEQEPTYFSRITSNTKDVACRNRYGNVLTLDDTRVRLKTMKPGESDYINSSFVGFENCPITIVAQAPMSHTCEDFWRMCWEQNVPLIVMLTDFEEPLGGAARREKSFRYYPEIENQRLTFGDFSVICESKAKEAHEGWKHRSLSLIHEPSKEIKSITHIHCVEWPDFGRLGESQLKGLASSIQLVQEVRSAEKGPPVVHCSAGIGRSGTFVALDVLMHLASKNQWDNVDVLKVVSSLRNQRPGMVQTAAQYEMIYDVLVHLLLE